MVQPDQFHPARLVLADAVAAAVFPAAVAEVGSAAGVLWRDALGTRTSDEASPAIAQETPFDLASLTKPLATTTIALHLFERRPDSTISRQISFRKARRSRGDAPGSVRARVRSAARPVDRRRRAAARARHLHHG